MARTIHVATRDEMQRVRDEHIRKGWSVRYTDDGMELFKVRQNKRGWSFFLGTPYVIYYHLTGGRERRIGVTCAEAPRIRISSDGRYWSSDGTAWHDAAITPPPEALGPIA